MPVLGLAGCHWRQNWNSRYVTPASQSHISHECSPLRWAISCKHEIAPLLYKGCLEVLHLFRWSTHTHTHALQQQGRWKGNESEMTMKIRWRLPNRDTRRGTQKKGKGENTITNTSSPERANPERAREKKKQTDDGPNTDQRRGGRTEAPDTTYKARAKPTSAREGPKPDLPREHTWNRGPMGT